MGYGCAAENFDPPARSRQRRCHRSPRRGYQRPGLRSMPLNAVMAPIAKALSSDDIADVTAYYASSNAPYLPLASPNPALIKRGEQLAKVGDAARELQSCDNCHGPGGAGEPPAIPYLAGQYARYIAFQLTMWKRGFRNNSPDAMADVAKRLDKQEIAAVAAYFQQVDASAPAATPPKR